MTRNAPHQAKVHGADYLRPESAFTSSLKRADHEVEFSGDSWGLR